jgi:hypothetical protein
MNEPSNEQPTRQLCKLNEGDTVRTVKQIIRQPPRHSRNLNGYLRHMFPAMWTCSIAVQRGCISRPARCVPPSTDAACRQDEIGA